MSIEAVHWVFSANRVTRGHERLVLLAFANEADTGTGYCFPSLELLSEHSTVSRSSLFDIRDALVADGQLLAKPPSRRGRGHHYEYVVVMGRDPLALADLRGWPRPALSQVALARRDTWIPVEVPVPRSTESPVARSTRKVRATDLSPPERVRKGSGKGPEKVRPTDTPQPQPLPLTQQRAPRAAAPAPARPDVDPLAALQAALREVGVPDVDWRMSAKQLALAAAAVEVHGPARLAEVARDRVDAKGVPDRAVAWLGPWTSMTPARQAPVVVDGTASRCDVPDLPPACGQCDGHHGGPRRLVLEDGRPGDWCPRCSRYALMAAAF